MIENIGWATFLFFSLFDFGSSIFSFFCVKETMGKSLEQMENEFRIPANENDDLTKKGDRQYAEHVEET